MGTTTPVTRAPNVLVSGANGRMVGKKAAGRLLDGRTWDEVPS